MERNEVVLEELLLDERCKRSIAMMESCLHGVFVNDGS